jgi:hypothetical protein
MNFRVKATFKSKKENSFIYHIPPGSYEILDYFWTESKWYGGKMFIEPIFKGVDSRKLIDIPGSDRPKDLVRYNFIIAPNTLNYIGEWDFSTGIISFTDNKMDFDKSINEKYDNLQFIEAINNLPH